MAFLTRDDGEHFVIPSYRDVISKRKNQLKDELLELSARYGEYITFQRRGLAQFEVAFSNEAGYLFGECVWHYFKRPSDLIYCEAIPNTTEAYFVIVKEGSVYLDGAFPLENIAEELRVFTTQINQFEIYVFGAVPLSAQPAKGKFSFDPSSVKSFTVLDEPLFQGLPVVKAYQLQLVDIVLRQQGIGVFPIKQIISVMVLLGLIWMGYTYLTLHKRNIPLIEAQILPNPFFEFNHILMSEAPNIEIEQVVFSINVLSTMPGWVPTELNYSQGSLTVSVKSMGTNVGFLNDWALRNRAKVLITSTGFSLSMILKTLPKRGVPDKIYPLDRVIMNLIDRIAAVMPGNTVKVGQFKNYRVYKESEVTIELTDASPQLLALVAEQLKDLPLVLTKLSLKINHGLTGTINLQALGN